MKPILFNTKMIKAILSGHKTVTRQKVKNAVFEHWVEVDFSDDFIKHPENNMIDLAPYQVGDILWVREKTYGIPGGINNQDLCYATHCPCGLSDEEHTKAVGWRPSVHMPKEAARIFLKVTDVRVERLQDITESQVEAEGADIEWDSNPWVWVIEFEKLEVS